MSNLKRIEQGDRVRVYHWNEDYEAIEGYVDYIPGSQGESWIIIQDDDQVIYVQQFGHMLLLKKGNHDVQTR